MNGGLAGFLVIFAVWLLSASYVTSRLADTHARNAEVQARYARGQELLSAVRSQVLLGSIYLRDAMVDTGSERGIRFVRRWDEFGPKFVKVYPNDYRRVIETQKRFKLEGLGEVEAEMAAFEENARDLARVGGK